MFKEENFLKRMEELFYDALNKTTFDVENQGRFRIRNISGDYRTIHNNGGSSQRYGRDVDNGATPVALKTSDDSLVHNPLFYDASDVGDDAKSDFINCMALSADADKVLKEIRMWIRSAEWYKERNLNHKRGYCLYGLPGTGKSTFIKSVGMSLGIPVNVFDISTMNNNEFKDKWASASEYAPCINVIEDIDAVFNGRKNVVDPENGITFDCLLNVIDGIQQVDGILLFITTNNIDQIDSALCSKDMGEGTVSTRPGRIDKVLEMTPPSVDGRLKIAKRILVDFPSEIDKVVEEGINDTGAQFQERCSSLALKLFWNSKT